jgi:hypothetical protein
MSNQVKVTMSKNGKKYSGTLPANQLDKVTAAEAKGYQVVRYEVK